MESLSRTTLSELSSYLRTKRAGDQITFAELGHLPSLTGVTKGDLKRIAAYLAQEGVLEHRGDGNYFTGTNLGGNPVGVGVQPTYNPQSLPARGNREPVVANQGRVETANHTAPVDVRQPQVTNSRVQRLSEVAYMYFGPNPTIYRGIIVDEPRYDEDRGKWLKTGVEVLTPDGSVRFGIISPEEYEFDLFSHRRNRKGKLELITDKMKKDDVVLVRHTGEFTGKSGKPTWLFEPLVSIRDSDGATKNGKRIVTAVDGERILYLPIVEPGKVRFGVVNGVGYVEQRGGFSYSYTPVYVDGAGDKVGTVIPKVNVRQVSKERSDWLGMGSTHVFYIGEIPLPAEEKTKKELGQIDNVLETMRGQVSSLQLQAVVSGSEDVTGIERAYVRTLGLFRYANQAGMGIEVAKRRNELRQLMSRIAAIDGLSRREQVAIAELYREGSEEYQQFMTEWPSMVETLLNKLEGKGRFNPWFHRTSEEKTAHVKERREQQRLSLLEQGPSYAIPTRMGFFAYNLIGMLSSRQVLQPYVATVNSAFDMVSQHIEASHDWSGRFSMDDFLQRTSQNIDETVFWNTVRRSFRSVNIPQTWGNILGELNQHPEIFGDELQIYARIMQPYIRLFERMLFSP